MIDLDKVKFHLKIHFLKEDEGCSSYESIGISPSIEFCDHVPYVDGAPSNRSYRHYRVCGKIYKTQKKFLEAIKDIDFKEV